MMKLIEGVPPKPKRFEWPTKKEGAEQDPSNPATSAARNSLCVRFGLPESNSSAGRVTVKTIPIDYGTDKRLVYLAAPYTHPDRFTKVMRFHIINKVAAYLMSELGLFIFSPISHSHPIAEDGDIPTTWEFWRPYDEEILRCCGRMVVLTLPGWEESKGVQAEIELATKMGVSISYLDPRGLI